MFLFGSGILIGTPSGGGAPINFGLVQEVSMDESVQTKKLYGQNRYPLAIGQGEASIVCKAKVARISAAAYAYLFHGVTPVAGTQAAQYGETVPTSTVGDYTAANGAHFVEDQGALYATTGLPLTQIASGTPTAGQYKVNTTTGAYTFASADITAGVIVNYIYSIAAAGQTLTISNTVMGPSTSFSTRLFQYDVDAGKMFGVKLFKCIASKLTHQTKLTDFTIPEFDFEAIANPAGLVSQKFFGDAF